MELPNRPTKDPYKELPIKDYSYINTQKSNNRPKRFPWGWLIAALLAVILVGSGAFAYVHYYHHKAPNKTTTKHSQTISHTKSQAASSIPTTSYTSTTFNLTVNYPTSWSVTTQGNNSLSISSPVMRLTAADGKTVSGKIVFNVLNQGQIPAAFGSSSVSVLDSQDLSFTTPTPYQAAQTYISFIQYPATTIKGGLDGIYVTGNNGYVKDQSVTAAQVNQVNPLIYVSFENCQNQTCANPTPLTIASTMWSDSALSTPVTTMIKSLTFS
ncbi:MAG: hypothetical protein ACYCPS_01510 [Candidatus Saccharimonadales bacterium]